MTVKLFAAAALAALTWGAAVQADQVITPEGQRLARCKAELSVHGPLTVVQRGRSLVAVEKGLVTAEQAKAINDCARTLARRSRNRDIYPLYASAPNCYRNAPILYRGNHYCFRGR